MPDTLEHRMALEAIGFAAQILTPQADYLGQLIRAEQQMHSSLHITNPTLYMRALQSDELRRQVKLAKAALAFILAVQKVKSELEDTADG